MNLIKFYVFALVCGNIAVVHCENGNATTVPTPPEPPSCQDDYWLVKKETNETYCLIMYADITVNFNKTSTVVFSPSKDAHASGDCGTTNETLTVVYNETILSFIFTKNTGDGTFNMSFINVTYQTHTSEYQEVTASWLRNIESTKIFQCNSTETIFKNDEFQVTVANMKLDAFQTTNKPCAVFFNSTGVSLCSDDVVSNLVPIIVGACLGALIVIVLVAYLIGRHRSRRGYESV